MQAMLLPAFGQAFTPGEIDTPTPGPGQLLIRVRASSVNPIDTKIRAGAVPPVSPELPGVLHGDVAGTVEAVGEGVTDFAIGDSVYGIAGGFKGHDGALAEFMRVNASAMAPMPKNLDFGEAAALPLVACTAWMALFDKGGLTTGQKALIQGGTGGVGHVAVQLAALAGAEVTATASSDDKAAMATRLGAHHVIRHDQADSELTPIYDLVFDTPGGVSLDRSFEAARPGGTVVGIAGRSEHNLGLLHTKELTLKFAFLISYFIRPDRDQAELGRILRQITRFVEAEQLTPVIAESYPMSQVNEAHARLEQGGFMGKIILTADFG